MLSDDEQRSCEEEFRSKDAEYVRSRFCEPEDETACCAKSYVTHAGIIEQLVFSRAREYHLRDQNLRIITILAESLRLESRILEFVENSRFFLSD